MVKIKFTVEISVSESQTQTDTEKEAQKVVKVLQEAIKQLKELPNQKVQ